MTRPSPSTTQRDMPASALKKRTAPGGKVARGGGKKREHAGGGKADPFAPTSTLSPASIAAAARAGIDDAAADAAARKINLIEVTVWAWWESEIGRTCAPGG
jgi:hypothetical protein